MPIPTPQELARAYRYDPETGVVHSITGQRPGPIGYEGGRGYTMVSINGGTLLAHRVGWALEHGEWPAGQIDHINGDKADNRLANLRDVSAAANSQNQHAARKTNRTKLLGVTLTETGRFMARMFVNGQRHYLGVFPTAELAHRAYVDGKTAAEDGSKSPT